MKVLFVCRSNVGRSQMAAALYDHLYPGEAVSAGTQIDIPGQLVRERARGKNAIIVMNELGLNIADNARTPITPGMVDGCDRVISMSEPEITPDYVLSSPKLEQWNVEDPSPMNVDDTREIRDIIAHKVKDLGERLHQ